MAELKYLVHTSGEKGSGDLDWGIKFASPSYKRQNETTLDALHRLNDEYTWRWKCFGRKSPAFNDELRPTGDRPGFALLPWNSSSCLACVFYPWSDSKEQGRRPNTGSVAVAVPHELCGRVTPVRFIAALMAQNDLHSVSRPRCDGYTQPRPDMLQFDENNLSDDAPEELSGVGWPLDGMQAVIIVNGMCRTLRAVSPPSPPPPKKPPSLKALWAAVIFVALAFGGYFVFRSNDSYHPRQPGEPQPILLPGSQDVRPTVPLDHISVPPVSADVEVPKHVSHAEKILQVAGEKGLEHGFALYEVVSWNDVEQELTLGERLYGEKIASRDKKYSCQHGEEYEGGVVVSVNELEKKLKAALAGQRYRNDVWLLTGINPRQALKNCLPKPQPEQKRADVSEIEGAKEALAGKEDSRLLVFASRRLGCLRFVLLDGDRFEKLLISPLPDYYFVLSGKLEKWFDEHVMSGNENVKPSLAQWQSDTPDKVVFYPVEGAGSTATPDSMAKELAEDFKRTFKNDAVHLRTQ